jgi:hypothetical protein
MTFQEIRDMAKKKGINSFGKTKVDLVREIQKSEGNFACFKTAVDHCDQLECCFRTICLTPSEGKDGLHPLAVENTRLSEKKVKGLHFYSTKYRLANLPFVL